MLSIQGTLMPQDSLQGQGLPLQVNQKANRAEASISSVLPHTVH